MTMVKWEPFKELLTFQDQVNRVFDPHLNRENGHLVRDWVPAVDVFEDNEAIEIRAEIPGMNRKDIEIKLEGDLLLVQGDKKIAHDQKEKYRKIESVYGQFARSFTLPKTVDTQQIQARYQDGILKLVLPKREETKPRTIAVEVK